MNTFGNGDNAVAEEQIAYGAGLLTDAILTNLRKYINDSSETPE